MKLIMKMKRVLQYALPLVILLILFCTVASAETVTHTVQKGESLWIISRKYATTVDEIKRLNKLSTDSLNVGQKLVVIESATSTIQKPYIIYTVRKGDTLGKIAEAFGVKLNAITSLNGLNSDLIYVGQQVKVPAEYVEHIVISGDTLYKLSLRYNASIDKIKLFSNIDFDGLIVGQKLKIPGNTAASPPAPAPSPGTSTTPTITYKSYKVVSGDTFWKISVKQGIPMTELLQVNKLNMESVLNIGQTLTIPVHHIPVKSTPGAKYGEYLDWWTEAQYVVPIDKVFTVTDFLTGKSFTIKRTIGANHADCEPLTAADTEKAKAVWGGFSWNVRAVIVTVDGRKLAASMSFYPHDVSYINNNNFNGHFDIYFANCTRHKDGKPDPAHQMKVEIAAGR